MIPNTIVPISVIQEQITQFLTTRVCDDDQKIYVQAFPNDPRELVELVHKENLVLVQLSKLERVLQNESFSQGKLSSINAYNKRGCAVARWSLQFTLWFSLASYYYKSCTIDSIDYIANEIEGQCLITDSRLSPMSVFSVEHVEFKPPESDNCLYYYKLTFNMFLTTTGNRELVI